MKAFSRALYALGTLAVAVLAVIALLRAPWVPFPGTMLPMALAAWLLRRHGALHLRRPALVWLPVLPCALCALYAAAVLAVALVKSVLHTALP